MQKIQDIDRLEQIKKIQKIIRKKLYYKHSIFLNLFGLYACKFFKIKEVKNGFLWIRIYKRKKLEEYFLVVKKITQYLTEKVIHIQKNISPEVALEVLTHPYPWAMVFIRNY